MWHLEKIKATNVASFKELEFAPSAGVTTLVFGNNKDNTSNQPSNGSGKSALIEAIAIAITGDPLRRVKVEEIIRDDAETMVVSATMWNDESKDEAVIERTFSRKAAQKVRLLINNEESVQPTVLDYNRCIMELIGITKDEFYLYFILTEAKYSSFFAASDREKKAIINKFSNADIIDQAIFSLQDDMKPIEDTANEYKLNIERVSGSIEVLEEQLKATYEREEEDNSTKEQRKEAILANITSNRQNIRNSKNKISEYEKNIENCKSSFDHIKDMESDNDLSFNDEYTAILADLNLCGIDECFKDWHNRANCYISEIAKSEKEMEDAKRQSEELNRRIELGKNYVSEYKVKHLNALENYKSFMDIYDARVKEIDGIVNSAKEEHDKANKKLLSIKSNIYALQSKISGVITCPKCSHRFTLSNDVSVEDTEKEIEGLNAEYRKLFSEVDGKDWFGNTQELYDDIRNKKVEEQVALNKIEDDLNRYVNGLKSLENQLSSVLLTITRVNNNVISLHNDHDSIRRKMYDQAYEIIEDHIEKCRKDIEINSGTIAYCEGAIESCEKRLEDIDNSSWTSHITGLTRSLEEKKALISNLEKEINVVNRKLEEMVSQDKRFTRFKGHLANSKINALSQMLNGILEQLGSDLRVRIDGYKMLKNGMVRDKITVSILKEGIEFGSYFKLSKGERSRIDTACMLAMAKLINANCDKDKGLELLVMDEILNGVDELGLLAIYEALNKLHITTIVVSHNPVTQAYPYTLTVTKEHGISTIN